MKPRSVRARAHRAGLGGGGVVVEATNRETGGKVALKMVAIKNEGQCGLAEGGSLCQERIWKS